MTKKRRTSVGQTIGGIVAGIEQQIFRSTPPAQELVAKGTPLRPVAAADGGTISIVLPDDPADDTTATADTTAAADTPPDAPNHEPAVVELGRPSPRR